MEDYIILILKKRKFFDLYANFEFIKSKFKIFSFGKFSVIPLNIKYF